MEITKKEDLKTKLNIQNVDECDFIWKIIESEAYRMHDMHNEEQNKNSNNAQIHHNTYDHRPRSRKRDIEEIRNLPIFSRSRSRSKEREIKIEIDEPKIKTEIDNHE